MPTSKHCEKVNGLSQAEHSHPQSLLAQGKNSQASTFSSPAWLSLPELPEPASLSKLGSPGAMTQTRESSARLDNH